MIAVMCALEEEIRHIKKMSSVKGSRFATRKISGSEFCLTTSGIGRDNVESTLSSLCKKYEIETLISTGFAAGLNREFSPGDVILARKLSTNNEDEHTAISVNGKLLKQAKSILDGDQIEYRIGEITTADCVARKKMKLSFLNEQPLALDMESYWIANMAEAKNIPYIIGRVILDRIDDNLPSLNLMEGKNHIYRAFLFHLLTHPWELNSYLSLFTASRKAKSGIAQLVTSLVGGLASHD